MGAPAHSPGSRIDSAHAQREISVCVVVGGRLREVQATYDPATGDTLYGGRPFRTAFADTVGYAANKRWYLNNEPITWERRRYEKYGPPRIISPGTLRTAGQHDGVTIFAEARTAGAPDIIYVPTRPGCEFHLYQWDARPGPIRGL
jgi:hypothetical protein